MQEQLTRRETLRRTLGVAGALAMIPGWAVPALAQGEMEVPFIDLPPNFNPAGAPGAATRMLDIRTIDGLLTPADKFFAIQHFTRPQIDANSYRLKLTGLFKKEMQLSLADLRAIGSADVVAGYECSGNSARSVQGLSSCGRFTGVPLAKVLDHAGVQPKAREVVFFGADRGAQEIQFRQQTYKLEQQFGRSITLENAMKPDPLLAWALNGEPLRLEHGAPVRLIMPGWYGVANVKWLSEIHLQEDRYLGNYQARWYRTLRGVGGTGADTDPETQWVETEVTRLRLKSVVARVRKSGTAHQILGFVLNDGTPLRSVEVQIDGGPWQKATLDKANTKFSWKLFTYTWQGATPGEHTIVSRATDEEGNVQPTAAELSRKKTFLEDNAQYPRKVRIS